MLEISEEIKKIKQPKKITKQRLKNIALYYLKRFDSSIDNLRQVLKKRVLEYAYYNPEWDKSEAFAWVEELLDDFVQYGYLNDERYTEIKVKNYLAAGKSARYIAGKLRQKGISESSVIQSLEVLEYQPFEVALNFARKKKIGPFRAEDQRENYRQKDLATLVRAGFDYDTVLQVLGYEV